MEIDELKDSAIELGIPEGIIDSCRNSLICLVGLIKYKYLKNNLDKFNNEVAELRETILEIEKEIVKNLLISRLNNNIQEIQVILDYLDENEVNLVGASRF